MLAVAVARDMSQVQHRHGLGLLVHATVLCGLASCSRGVEGQADTEVVRILRAGGISPLVSGHLFCNA